MCYLYISLTPKFKFRNKMKKLLIIAAAALFVSNSTFAGGILTNTNQHASFLRMPARGASIAIDGTYSNPAGLAFLQNEGLHYGLTIQNAYQTRNIDATFGYYNGVVGGQQAIGTLTQEYKGTASAPVIPSIQAAYKKGNWVLSGSFAITGGGGKASFSHGLPMFTSVTMAGIYQATKGTVIPGMYDIKTAMSGHQYIFGAQLGLSYKVNEWLGVFGGGRMNYVSSGYKGFVDATLKEQFGGNQLMDIQLDCDQSGWGLTPIIGADVKLGKWNFGAKYEFKTNLNIENNTKTLKAPDGVLKDYEDGVNTPNDIPSLLTVAAQYSILPNLRAAVEYHFYDDKSAGMAHDKNKALTKGTNEYLFGIEWDVLKRLTLSGGYQNTDYGLSDGFQSDTSFYCDSYSLGFGAEVKMTEKLNLNVGYFWTNYKDYKKEMSSYNGTGLPGTDTYSRTNKVFGVSLNYSM